MAMSTAYLDAIANAGRTTVTHIGLVDGSGNEITGGGYTRQPVTWTASSNGVIRPTADLTFQVPSGATVAGWRGYSASSGGTNYGGADLTPQNFASAGTYTLLAASTSINHTAV